MSIAWALPLVFVASLAAAGPRVDVTGDYTSNWGDVHLVQEGTHVHGTYVCCGGGTLDGVIVEARVLRYHWREPNGAGEGEGVWTITRSGRLEGTWGFGKSSSNGGPWTLELASQRSQVAR